MDIQNKFLFELLNDSEPLPGDSHRPEPTRSPPAASDRLLADVVGGDWSHRSSRTGKNHLLQGKRKPEGS